MFIFSIGILGLLSLQALSVKNAGEAQYRTDASFLANGLIGQMWADDRTPSYLQTQYQAGSAKYNAWYADIQTQLPGAADHAPTVTINTIAGSSPPASSKSRVNIVVRWQSPGDPTTHSYTALTEIK